MAFHSLCILKAQAVGSVLPTLERNIGEIEAAKKSEELETVLVQINAKGVEWRNSARDNQEVKERLGTLEALLEPKIRAFIEDLPKQAGKVLSQEECNVATGLLDDIERCVEGASAALRYNDMALNALETTRTVLSDKKDLVSQKLVYCGLFKCSLFTFVAKADEELGSLNTSKTLPKSDMLKKYFDAAVEADNVLAEFTTIVPNIAYEARVVGAVNKLALGLDNVLKAELSDEARTLEVLGRLASLGYSLTKLLPDSPTTEGGKNVKVNQAGMLKTFAWGFRLAHYQVTLAGCNPYQKKEARAAAEMLVEILDKPPGLVDRPLKLFADSEKLAKEAVAGQKKEIGVELCEELNAGASELKKMAATFTWQTAKTSLDWKELEKQVTKVLLTKEKDGALKILKLNQKATDLGTLITKTSKKATRWTLGSDKAINTAVEQAQAEVKSAKTLTVEADYCVVLLNEAEGSHPERNKTIAADQLRISKGVALDDVP